MNELPDELAARRDSILARVTKRGRRLRRRRLAATTALVVLAVSVPLAAVAVSVDRDGGAEHLRTLAPPTTQPTVAPSTTVAAPPTTTAPTVPTTVPSGPATTTAPAEPGAPTTTALDCHNRSDPVCGPFHYDPPLLDKPATLVLVKVEQAPTPQGDRVTFTLHASDPDSRLVPGPEYCGYSSFGDGTMQNCEIPCPSGHPPYGTWDPPPAHPSAETYTSHHVYTAAGTFEVTFTVAADRCGPRRSEASVSVTVHATV